MKPLLLETRRRVPISPSVGESSGMAGGAISNPEFLLLVGKREPVLFAPMCVISLVRPPCSLATSKSSSMSEGHSLVIEAEQLLSFFRPNSSNLFKPRGDSFRDGGTAAFCVTSHFLRSLELDCISGDRECWS